VPFTIWGSNNSLIRPEKCNVINSFSFLSFAMDRTRKKVQKALQKSLEICLIHHKMEV
jgi:hypothetical protein